MSKKPAAAVHETVAAENATNGEARRWAASTFTDDQLLTLQAVMAKKPPLAKAPKDLRDLVIAEAARQGLTVSDAKAVLRRAMTPASAGPARTTRGPGGGKGGFKIGAPAKSAPVDKSPPAKKAAPKKATAKVVKLQGKSKKVILFDAISAPGGATLTRLMTLTGWQAHSIRGAIATLKTQDGNAIDSGVNDKGERFYELKPAKRQAAAAAAGPRAKAVKAGKAKR